MWLWKALLCIALILLAVVLYQLAALEDRVVEQYRHSQVPWQRLVSEPTNPVHTLGCPVFEAKRKGEQVK
jgi:hypothetical protein